MYISLSWANVVRHRKILIKFSIEEEKFAACTIPRIDNNVLTVMISKHTIPCLRLPGSENYVMQHRELKTYRLRTSFQTFIADHKVQRKIAHTSKIQFNIESIGICYLDLFLFFRKISSIYIKRFNHDDDYSPT